MRTLQYVIETLVIVQCAAFVGWRQKRFPWVRFAAAQIFQIEATLVGWFVLIPFCLAHEWEASPIPSIKDGRAVDQWTWWPLGYVYNNPEDGVSGQQAIVFSTGQAGPYMPGAWAPWRAYCWSALRNSSDGLKYVFAWKEGPLATGEFSLSGVTVAWKAGWQSENSVNVPILSLSRV